MSDRACHRAHSFPNVAAARRQTLPQHALRDELLIGEFAGVHAGAELNDMAQRSNLGRKS